MHGYKARAESFDAGIVLVATALVDPALASQRCFQRLDRQAAALGAAVATALANLGVDEGAHLRVGPLAALAQAPAFGGAGLVVDQHGSAMHLTQLSLHAIQLAAMVYRHVGRQAQRLNTLQIFRGNDDVTHPFRLELLNHLGHRYLAIDRLSAGHRDKAVDQQLVGDVDLARHR
ncbi:hypothetical protein SDC9_144806 [bioreactor metagenome]|uniref:Uncharacterized protein n=1 Tax=bioreactor metagenome TaxID=1076179 RepID=A0A645E877_9ZZZZ